MSTFNPIFAPHEKRNQQFLVVAYILRWGFCIAIAVVDQYIQNPRFGGGFLFRV